MLLLHKQVKNEAMYKLKEVRTEAEAVSAGGLVQHGQENLPFLASSHPHDEADIHQ